LDKIPEMNTVSTGSDLSLADDGTVHVSFNCDGEFVTFQFLRGARYLGEPQRLSRADAIEEGKLVAETGISKHLPDGIILSINEVKNFGLRLRMYGEDGK
jgi:hypothetical protein